MKQGDRHNWTLFSSLSGKASQQACYWPHPPGEGVGQCNREQGTILDHLTIISKCTPVAISAGPPWECPFCSQLCLCFILLHRNLVMQIALLTLRLTTGKEAGSLLEYASVLPSSFNKFCFFQSSFFFFFVHCWAKLLSNKPLKSMLARWEKSRVIICCALNIHDGWFAKVQCQHCFSCLQYI